ncbi:MAG: restriction endonuclease [Dehalococcoidia bacterium]|nr:restriction endonuclease [Dehalococcoidia bacterium]
MAKVVPYRDLKSADLVVDAVYEGEPGGQLAGEALSELLPGIGNLGGFRAAGTGDAKRFVVLHSSGADQDWPDYLDTTTGRFQYYGDNKKPGHELHETSPGGNRLLRNVFAWLHHDPPRRGDIPPFFVFEAHRTERSSRSFRYRGLAVPGAPGLPGTEDLVAVWKTFKGERFQNYRSVFSILDAPTISRRWIGDLAEGIRESPYAPGAWKEWVHTGRYRVLQAESTTTIRSPEQQVPETSEKRAILDAVWRHFQESPREFERFAAHLFALQEPKAVIDHVTRYSRDGGRDAVGRYRLGIQDDPVHVEFALEAKCYRPAVSGKPSNSVGVSDVSRLISRIRHRQFGVMVTTSAIGRQAYEEVREDGHPIIFICGKDIADILTAKGLNTVEAVRGLLDTEFPVG